MYGLQRTSDHNFGLIPYTVFRAWQITFFTLFELKNSTSRPPGRVFGAQLGLLQTQALIQTNRT